MPQKNKAAVSRATPSIPSSAFFKYIRPEIFGGDNKQFTREEMDEHNRNFSRQLRLRFDTEKKQQNQATAQACGIRSAVCVDLDSNNKAHNVTTTNYHELSHYVLEDLLGRNH